MKKMYEEFLEKPNESIFPMDSFHTSKKPLDTSYTKSVNEDEEEKDEDKNEEAKVGVKSRFINTQSGNF
jgi:hypothetical protein